MKRRLAALALCLLLPLSGCAAMLERSYTSVQPYTQSVTGQHSGSALEAQTYQQLVSAVLYLVTQHSSEGIIRLYNYADDVENDLTRACLEVVQKDPLGAFAVDYIKHDVKRVVSFYEAQVSIAYLRSAEEMDQITAVTGSSAIKGELRETLSRFETKQLLQVSYYDDQNDHLLTLLRQAYYDTPAAAFGMPKAEITLYPDSGIQRIVEIDLTYPLDQETLLARQETLDESLAALPQPLPTDPQELYQLLLSRAKADPAGGNTAYSALVDGAADAEGLALAYQLLCGQAGLTCTVVQGEDAARFWNIVSTPSGSRHVDCFAGLFGLTDQQLREMGGYLWGDSYPLCRDGSETV